MHWSYLLSGFLLLLMGAYLDNVRGPLLPVLTKELSLDYSFSSGFLSISYFCATFITLTLNPLLNRFGERNLTQWVLGLGLTACLFSLFVTNYFSLLVLGILLGGAIATYGTLSSILVIEGTPLSKQSRMLSGLHLMYGLGAFLSPILAALFQENQLGWSINFVVVAPFLMGTWLWVSYSFPKDHVPPSKTTVTKRLSHMQILILVGFSAYVAGEVMISMWMVAFLEKYRGFTLSEAAPYLTGFFLVMAATRCLVWVSLKPSQERYLLPRCLILSILFFGLGHLGQDWAFIGAGLLGPFFPLFLARISRNFPEQWKTMTVWVLASLQLTLAIGHTVMGRLIDSVGVKIAYCTPFLFHALAIAIILGFLSWEKRHLKGDPIANRLA